MGNKVPAQIIAIGGGGFLTASEPGLDHYVLQQAAAERPRIGFVATASGDAASTFLKFYARFAPLNCQPSHLSFFDRTPDLEKWVQAQDIIYVSGGNTKSMLAVWREWHLPELLKRAMQRGTVLTGVSAGAICWFESGLTDSMQGDLMPLSCLGFLSGSCCPHYSGEPQRKPRFESYISKGTMPAGVAIDDGAAVHYVDGVPYRIAAGRAGAGAYLVAHATVGIKREALDVPVVTCVE
jgi:dipeptidase E